MFVITTPEDTPAAGMMLPAMMGGASMVSTIHI